MLAQKLGKAARCKCDVLHCIILFNTESLVGFYSTRTCIDQSNETSQMNLLSIQRKRRKKPLKSSSLSKWIEFKVRKSFYQCLNKFYQNFIWITFEFFANANTLLNYLVRCCFVGKQKYTKHDPRLICNKQKNNWTKIRWAFSTRLNTWYIRVKRPGRFDVLNALQYLSVWYETNPKFH